MQSTNMEKEGVRKTRADELQVVISLIILTMAIKSLVAVAMYWHGVLAASAVTASQFAIGMALSLAVVIAFAGLVAFACIKSKDVAREGAVGRTQSASLSGSEMLKSGVYDDSLNKQGNLRIALSTALGGLVAGAVISLGMFWNDVARAATTVAATQWVAGVLLAVAVAVAIASLVLLAQEQSQELPGREASQGVEEGTQRNALEGHMRADQAVSYPVLQRESEPSTVLDAGYACGYADSGVVVSRA